MSESFLGKMIHGGRVTVPIEIRAKLDLSPGDIVLVTVEKKTVV